MDKELKIDKKVLRIAILGYGNIGKYAEEALAAARLRADGKFGAFTLIEVPPVYMLPGSCEENVSALV